MEREDYISQEDYQACEHTQKIENYCKKCNIFLCEQCSMDHMDHIEDIGDWKSVIRSYLNVCLDFQKRGQLILKSIPSIDTIRAEIIAKVDSAFEQIVHKVRAYQERVKEEILEKFDKGEEGEEESSSSLRKLTEEMASFADKLIIRSIDGESARIIKAIQDTPLQSIENKIQLYREHKYSQLEKFKGLRQFALDNTFSYAGFMKNLRFQGGGYLFMDASSSFTFQSTDTSNSNKYGFLYLLSNENKSAFKNRKENKITCLEIAPILNSGRYKYIYIYIYKFWYRYEVVIRVDKYTSNNYQIGIRPQIQNNDCIKDSHSFCISEEGLYKHDALIETEGIKSGDFIKMNVDILNETQANLQFTRNQNKVGPLFTFNPSLKYFFSVAMRKIGSQASIVAGQKLDAA